MVRVETMASDSIEIKGSKFLAFVMPVSLYESQMSRLKSEHPKAVHWVSAWRSLNAFDQIAEYSSDDGEPKGTSGKPTLSVLQGHELINTAIITVRYFGGTKLGPGGLVRAYADAANAAVSAAVLLPYEKLFLHTIECDYPHITIVEYECGRCGVRIASKEFGEKGAVLDLEGTSESLEHLYGTLGRTVRQLS